MQRARINVDRIAREIAEVSEIGRDDKRGTTRLAYTKADVEARDWLIRRMEEADLSVEVDGIGNIFGWLPGRSNASPLLLGSHIDTVPGGGGYDGVLGVITALATVRDMTSEGWIPDVPVGIVSFACEEGSRFGMSSIGSRAITGGLTNNDVLRLRDRDGISLREALEAAGLSPEAVESLKREPGWFGAYLEAHIDQGPDLEDFGQPIGIVRVIAGVSRHRITFQGKQAHSGAARMGRRSDAMAAAAGAILIAEEEANARADEIVATVGTIEALPGIVNVLPNQVSLGLEVRTLSSAIEDAFLRRLDTRITEQARARDVDAKWELVSKSSSVMLPQVVREALALACADAGAAVHEVVSWALHDAAHMARHGPVGMLLVRNQGRVSHQPGELVRVDDLALLGNVLHAALCRMTKGLVR